MNSLAINTFLFYQHKTATFLAPIATPRSKSIIRKTITEAKMYYILFRSTALPDQSAMSDEYYKIARNMTGFIDETRFVDVQNPDVSFMFARFADEEAVMRWRNGQMRLGMMHNARKDILSTFRLTVGTDGAGREGRGRVVVVHRCPKREGDADEKERNALERATGGFVESEEVYTGEKGLMRVHMLRDGVDVGELEGSLQRKEGDEVYRVHVAREYGKTDRREAPKGLEEAETAAIAAQVN